MIPTLTPKGYLLVGIMGPAGSGKDTVANLLHVIFPWGASFSFADALKQAAAAKFGVDIDNFYDPEKKQLIDPFWGISYRQMIQWEGTEATRNTVHHILPHIGNQFWLYRHAKYVEEAFNEGFHNYAEALVTVPDVRFQNEYDYIVHNGGYVIDLSGSPIRGGGAANGIANHVSEQLCIEQHKILQTYSILNDGSLEELRKKVTDLANQLINIHKAKTL